MSGLVYWVWLGEKYPYPTAIKALFEHFDNPKGVYFAEKDALERIGIKGELLEKLSDKSLDNAKRIIGRCADYVLRERDDVLNVFIHAPMEYRAERANKVYEKEAGNMVDYVKKQDKKRASFYNYFSQNKWGDARHYHLALSGQYGVDYAVEILKRAVEAFPGGGR